MSVIFDEEFKSKLVSLLGEFGYAFSSAQEYLPGRYEVRIIPISISPPLDTKQILSFEEVVSL